MFKSISDTSINDWYNAFLNDFNIDLTISCTIISSYDGQDSLYTGNIKKGKAHGNGTMKYVDGSIYEGMWKENKKHGQGKLQYANGDIYIGQFQNDKCHGTGTIKYKDGREFNGIWENNKIVNPKEFSPDDKSPIGSFIGKLFGI